MTKNSSHQTKSTRLGVTLGFSVAIIAATLLSPTIAALLATTAARAEAPESDPVRSHGAAPRIHQSFGRLPVAFEPNRGQMDPRVKFLARNGGALLSLTPTQLVVTLAEPEPLPGAKTTRASRPDQTAESSRVRHTVALKLTGANPAATMEGVDPLPGTVNYLLGRDPAAWKVGIPTYTAVRSREVYRGIDVIYYGNQQQFEYDFVLAPGADPDAIRLNVEGARRVWIDDAGDLIMQIGDRVMRQQKPLAYQELNGVRQVVTARYVKSGRQIRFRVGDYDRRIPLVIDPVLLYSSYFGGLGTERGTGVAVDGTGSAYITGQTINSPGLATPGAYQSNSAGSFDGFVMKISPDGSQRLYTTYLGGSGSDQPFGIAVNTTGNAYVTGVTGSADFPVPNGFDTSLGGGVDGFLAKLNDSGTDLLYSTYLGGSGLDQALAIDAIGPTAYVTGRTEGDFPVTSNTLQPDGPLEDVFVAKIDTSQSGAASRVFVSYLGGDGYDSGQGIDADSNGRVYITGTTDSEATFPTTLTPCISVDAFAVRIDTLSPYQDGMSTCLNGAVMFGNAEGSDIAAGPSGSIYVTGYANGNFLLVPLPVDPSTIPDGFNAFVSRLNADGTVFYSRFVGGNFDDFGTGIAVDLTGSAYITGFTNSPDFPMQDAFQPSYGGNPNRPNPNDAFVTKLNPAGVIVYSSYFGGLSSDLGLGIAVDLGKNVYLTGTTSSPSLATSGAFQSAICCFNQPPFAPDAYAIKIAEINTPIGPDVVVSPLDTMTGNSPVTIKFPDVSQAGVTGLTTSTSGPNPPAGFQLGQPPTFYELTTTVVFMPPAEVCIDYSNISFGNEANLKLFHYDPNTNAWVDVTTSLDTVANIICGSVSSFSPFAIFEPIGAADASAPIIVPTVSPAPNGAGWNQGPVTVTWSLSDPESGIVSSAGCAPLTLTSDTPGTTLTCSAENGAGLTATVSVVVKIDTIAPALSCGATPSILWPPNHKLVAVTASVSVLETGSGAGAAVLTSATSNEPDNGTGDENVPNDVQGFVVGTADLTGFLRAERSGSGNGRVYTLSYAATDAAGNTGGCTALVLVPDSN